MSHIYSLGAVKPWVRSAAQEIGDKYDISTIYGVGLRPDATSDHPKGLATDFMVFTDRAKGDAVAAYVKQSWARLDVKYMIWQQRIDEGSGWKPMENRGSPTANHMDHVHVSYLPAAGGGREYAGNSTAETSTDSSGTGALAPVTSLATWVRVLEFLAGALILILIARSVITNAVL